MTDEELLASLADAVDRTYHHKDDAGLLDELARRLREQDGERVLMAGMGLLIERNKDGEWEAWDGSTMETDAPESMLVRHLYFHPQEPSNG